MRAAAEPSRPAPGRPETPTARSAASRRGPWAPPAGTGALLRLALRRDRITLPLWIVIFAAVASFSAAATAALYPDVASRVQAAAVVNATPSLLALYGPVYDPSSLGALALWKAAGWGAVAAALLTMLTVVRHTRADEECGRLELLGATAVGRGAPLTAALTVGAATAAALGSVTTIGLVLAGLPVAGSVAFGASWAAAGLVFAAVGGVAAQLTRSARAARGVAVAVLVLTYVARMVGDSSGPVWLSWVSPTGWSQQVRAFAGDRWWVLVIPVGVSLLIAAVAVHLDTRRDLDGALLGDRPGRDRAGRYLRGAFGLAWRLHRAEVLVWTVGALLLGFLLGNVAGAVGGMLDSPQMRDALARLGGQQAITEGYLAAAVGLLGLLAAVFAVQAMLRISAEEAAGRAGFLVAGGVGRLRWAMSHLAVAALGPALMLAVAGNAAGLADAARVGGVGAEVGRLAGAAVAQLPAVWVLVGLVLVLVGWTRVATAVAWLLVVAVLVLGEFGPLLQLPRWLVELSPFTHLPRLPGGEVSVTALVLLSLVAFVLCATGLAGLRRRDLA